MNGVCSNTHGVLIDPPYFSPPPSSQLNDHLLSRTYLAGGAAPTLADLVLAAVLAFAVVSVWGDCWEVGKAMRITIKT